MRRFNSNKKRVLRQLLNIYQPQAFRSIRGFNKLFGTQTNQTYNILDDLVGVVVIENPNLDALRQLLYNNRGKTIRVSYLINGEDVLVNNIAIDRNIQIPNFNTDIEFADWWAGEIWKWRNDTETDIFQDFDYAGKLYSRPQTSLATTDRIKQAYLDGLSHCVFTPITDWCNLCLAKAESDSSKKRYNAKLNKIKKMSIKYENGVPEDDIEELCKTLNIKICISYPFSEEEITYGEKLKHPDKVFNFINTRLNHLELGNFVINKKPEQVSRDFIYYKINELDESKEFYYTTKDNKGYNAIYTLSNCWSCSTEFNETLRQFELDNGMNYMKICDIENYELASFIKRGTHYNTSFGNGLLNSVSEHNVFNNEENAKSVKLIDQKKAYYNFKKCSFYEGFLGKITDFRATNKIMGVGLYLITDIKFTRKKITQVVDIFKGENVVRNKMKPTSFEELNEKMNWFKSNNVYTSAELKVLDKNKVSYKIIAGCWGIETFDFEFDKEFLQKTDKKPFVDENGELCMKGISFYAKATGTWDNHSTHHYRYIKGTTDYAQILKNNSNNTIIKSIDENEICIKIPKKHIKTLGHITAFILAYQRISLLEQLLEMNLEHLVGVYVDGIYYYEHEFMKLDNFEKKEIDSSVSFRQEGFLTNIYETKPKIVYAPYRENYKKELFICAGGNGKTHYNLTDNGLINKLYIAPSHKLNANKKAEYNVDVEVLACLLTDNPMNYNKIMKYNNLILDEVSMMSNEDKDAIIKKFPKHKLIFCGDVGFQLPCISTISQPKTELSLEGFDNIKEFTTNYRCKDAGLLERLNKLRERIKEGFSLIHSDFHELFTECDLEFIKKNYCCNDMIICGTNKAKDIYTNLFQDKKKWYITKNTDYYNNGDIIIQDEQPDKSAVIRHAYTAHSIQGETSYHKLFIDIATLQDVRAFYTAISRAKTLKQIFIVIR